MQAHGHGPSLPPFLAPDFALASNRGVPGTPPQACYHTWTQPSLLWALAGFLPAHCLLQRAGLLPLVLFFPRSHWITQISFLGSGLVQSLLFLCRCVTINDSSPWPQPRSQGLPSLGHMRYLPPRHISCPGAQGYLCSSLIFFLPIGRTCTRLVTSVLACPPTFSPPSPIDQACPMSSCEVRSKDRIGVS